MTDDTPSAEEVTGWLRADAVDCLYEWLRRTGPTDTVDGNPPSFRVRPQDDGTFAVEDGYGVELHRFRITVLVEPPVRWDSMTWESLATFPIPIEPDSAIRVRLAGVEADLLSAVVEGWHVDPRSSEYRPIRLEHRAVAVKIRVGTEEKMYRMPPTGKVEVRSGSLGEAVAAILGQFPGAQPIPDLPSPPALSES